MTFTLQEKDIYFIICIVLLAIQIYQRYLYSQLDKKIDEIGRALGNFMITGSQAIANLEKDIESLEKNVQNKS